MLESISSGTPERSSWNARMSREPKWTGPEAAPQQWSRTGRTRHEGKYGPLEKHGRSLSGSDVDWPDRDLPDSRDQSRGGERLLPPAPDTIIAAAMDPPPDGRRRDAPPGRNGGRYPQGAWTDEPERPGYGGPLGRPERPHRDGPRPAESAGPLVERPAGEAGWRTRGSGRIVHQPGRSGVPDGSEAGAGTGGSESGAPTGVGDRRRAGAADRRTGAPLIVTEDESLLDDLLRLCAAAGVEPEVSFGPPSGPGSWEAAPLVLVGDDCTGGLRRAQRRGGVLLIGRDLDDHDVWRRAVDIGADHVLFLPDAESWLVDRIADAAEGVGESALTIGVAGGRGGAGASTLATALAVTAARQGRRTMLVDADPLGGGLDVLLGCERTGGARWPDLAESQGRVSSGALEESLPRLHDLSVLSWDRGDSVVITPDAMRSVLGAARRRGGVVVVDLPRRTDETVVEALSQVDVGLLVVPAELRAVAAADRVASRMGMVLRDLRVVARGPFPAGLDQAEISRLLGLPLAGGLPLEKGLLEAVAGGEPPGAQARGPLARFCNAFLTEALLSRGSVTA